MAIPDSVRKTLDDMAETFDRKNADYATDSDPWTNFREAADQVNQTASDVVETLIAVKQSRLKQLFGTDKAPRNESVRDSLLDRAVYCVIALAMYDEQVPTIKEYTDVISEFCRTVAKAEDLPEDFFEELDDEWSKEAFEEDDSYRAGFDLLGEPVEGLWNVFEETPEYARDGTFRSTLLRWQVAPDGQIWNEHGKAYGGGLGTFGNTEHFTFVGAYDEPVWTVQHEDFPGFLENLEWNKGGWKFAEKLLEEGKTVVIGNNGYRYTFSDPFMTADATRPDGSYAGFGFTLDRMTSLNNKIVKVSHG